MLFCCVAVFMGGVLLFLSSGVKMNKSEAAKEQKSESGVTILDLMLLNGGYDR
jgi:hypothetical protein